MIRTVGPWTATAASARPFEPSTGAATVRRRPRAPRRWGPPRSWTSSSAERSAVREVMVEPVSLAKPRQAGHDLVGIAPKANRTLPIADT